MLRTYNLDTLSAVGTSATNDVIAGELVAVHVLHNTAGTMTLATVHDPVVPFMTMTTTGTAWYYPRANICNGGGTALSFGTATSPVPTLIPFADNVHVYTNAAGTTTVQLMVKS